MEEYKKQDVDFWAITTVNEPRMAGPNLTWRWPALQMTDEEERWVSPNSIINMQSCLVISTASDVSVSLCAFAWAR